MRTLFKKNRHKFFLKKNCKKFIGTNYSFIVSKRQKNKKKKNQFLILFFGGLI